MGHDCHHCCNDQKKKKKQKTHRHGPHVGDHHKKGAKKQKGKHKSKDKSKGKSKDEKGSYKFVLKGKMPPAPKDGIMGPSRLMADDMTTIYTVPSDSFKTETDVVAFNGYEIGEQIGKGGFAVVFKAKNVKTGQAVACKTVQVKNQDAVIEMKNELFIMEKVKNPFAVKLYMHFLVNEKLFIFMALADAGCFGKMLEKEGVLGEKDAKFYFAQMCAGVENMHHCNVAHRDIKPANFLMANHPSGRKLCMVSDYGLSRVVHKDGSGKPLMYGTQCGTPIYMAPEILQGKEYNCYLVDVWSLGCTLFAMLNLMTPFNCEAEDGGVKQMLDKDWEFSAEKMKEPPSEDLKGLMGGLLEPDFSKRLTMKGAVSHKWLRADYEEVKKMVGSKSGSGGGGGGNKSKGGSGDKSKGGSGDKSKGGSKSGGSKK